MQYSARRNHLSKPDVYELTDAGLAVNGAETPYFEVQDVHFWVGYGGFTTARIRHARGTIAINSHSAQSFGKGVANQRHELAIFLSQLAERLPAETAYRVGSNRWRAFGMTCVAFSVIATLILIGVWLWGPGRPARMEWDKLAGIPILFAFGWFKVANSGVEQLDRDGFKSHLARF